MVSLWNTEDAPAADDLLGLRVYTSRLLGQSSDLVLHGGGNTSVKIREKNLFGEEEDILYVKGSGWDLATIEGPGFAPVKLSVLHQLADLPTLTDAEMVKNQRSAMTDPSAPNPSVEAILHGIIPFTFVDHTHADAVVTLTNTPGGEETIRNVYGDRMLIVPYVMPGFILARTIYEMTRDIDWSSIDGMILMNHGVFTFDNDPRKSYERMIEIVDRAEQYIADKEIGIAAETTPSSVPLESIARIRKKISELTGKPMLVRLDASKTSAGFSSLPNVSDITSRGPLTPDHIIRTKRTPWMVEDDIEDSLDRYAGDYEKYFNQYANGEQMLDPAPRWCVMEGAGILSVGPTPKHLRIIEDITHHTQKAIFQAEALGGWNALPAKDLFEVEYWELEQAKLRKAGTAPLLQGKVALITGAASGIGKACVTQVLAAGGVVIALDIDPKIEGMFASESVVECRCDITDRQAVAAAIRTGVHRFGGLDMVISNAGIFPPSAALESMPEETWERSLQLNLTSHQQLLQQVTPLLKLGMGASFLIIGSKNVPAPGPGAAAYSVAKAGLTQMARVAALELGKEGIRVNVIHPNAVYDTGIWTPEVLEARARHYGLSVEEYKTNNVLKVEVTSADVAGLAVQMLTGPFTKITGAQVPIDGGNERII